MDPRQPPVPRGRAATEWLRDMKNLTSRRHSAFGLAAALLLNALLAGVYDLSTVKCMHGRLSGTRDGCVEMSLAGYGWQHHRLDVPVVLLLVPATLAIIGAPGFVYAVFARGRWRAIGRVQKSWISASLIVSVLASAGAAIASIPTGLGPILALWTLVMAIKLSLIIRKESHGHDLSLSKP